MKETSFLVQTQFHERPPLLPTRRPEGCALVIFGATGDLAERKLLPALYNLAAGGALPRELVLLGVSRSSRDDAELSRRWRAAVERFSRTRPIQADVWSRFAGACAAVQGDFDDPATYRDLGERLKQLDLQHGTGGNHLFYLATPPSAFPKILRRLSEAGLVRRASEREAKRPWSRVVIEKPFGHDKASARALNHLALSVLSEDQIYRIDHYLGKETVQNILVLRFGNTIFEPLWNRNHIESVQITMAETIGVEGRGAFYEETGVVRDIVQNHLLQVLALCAMEPPISFDANEIRDMKSQVLRSLRPMRGAEVEEHVVRGQYSGYRQEDGVAAESCTPTFVAMRAFIDNWRWQGVPFYLRAGKGLAARVTEVAFHFRTIPFCLFGDQVACKLVDPNVLTLRIQPNEGIALRIASKIPGEDLAVGSVQLDFRYDEAFDREPPEAYERLLLDCMRGDATLFARRDEVEASWGFVTPLLEAWAASAHCSIPIYARGGEGPPEAAQLLRHQGHRWRGLVP